MLTSEKLDLDSWLLRLPQILITAPRIHFRKTDDGSRKRRRKIWTPVQFNSVSIHIKSMVDLRLSVKHFTGVPGHPGHPRGPKGGPGGGNGVSRTGRASAL